MQVPFCNLLRACSLYHLQILSLSAVGVCAAALTSHTPKEEDLQKIVASKKLRGPTLASSHARRYGTQ